MKFTRASVLMLATFMGGASLASDGPQWSEWGDDLFARAAALAT
jgi:hypothetical protein